MYDAVGQGTHIMKVFVVLCLVLINVTLNIANSHGSRMLGTRGGRIIGGYDASPQSHPYLVSLQMRFLWARMRLCSGSLLNERWILTAGHCVKGSWLINWLTMEAVVGTNDLEKKDSTAQTVRISERIPHPNYNGGIGPFDIAMLKTAKKINYNSAVSPIEVPLSMGSLTHKSQNLILAGWGVLETTVFIPALPDKLQEARVEYLSFEECKKAIDAVKESFEDNPLDRLANICTGPITGGVAACSGDSGGPLIQYIVYNNPEPTTTTQSTIEQETESWTDNSVDDQEPTRETTQTTLEETEYTANDVDATTDSYDEKSPNNVDLVQHYIDKGLIPVIIGVVSWGISPCGEVGAPTVYTNVSTYADFIYTHLYN